MARESRPHARYFLTLCVRERRRVLTCPDVAAALRSEFETMEGAGDIVPLEWVIMPDHVHWLFELGSRLPLGRLVARFKTQTRVALASVGAEWQRDYYEHRLRPDESADAYAAYIFKNPYRARLIPPDVSWPHGGTGRVIWGFRQNLIAGESPHFATEPERPRGW